MKPLIVIPARMGSSRLPGKPLMKLSNLPMIMHIYNKAQKTGFDVLIAAGDKEIVDVAKKFNANVILTETNLPSGTDRVKAAVDIFDKEEKYNVIVNLQGDLPTINSESINRCIEVLDQGFDIGTVAIKIQDELEKEDPNVVKPIISFNNYNSTIGRALYFTRAKAPHGEGSLYHHIGIYAFKRHRLIEFTSLKPSVLEKRESLEQLRALEANMTIGVAIVDDVSISVDTIDDFIKAESYLNSK